MHFETYMHMSYVVLLWHSVPPNVVDIGDIACVPTPVSRYHNPHSDTILVYECSMIVPNFCQSCDLCHLDFIVQFYLYLNDADLADKTFAWLSFSVCALQNYHHLFLCSVCDLGIENGLHQIVLQRFYENIVYTFLFCSPVDKEEPSILPLLQAGFNRVTIYLKSLCISR